LNPLSFLNVHRHPDVLLVLVLVPECTDVGIDANILGAGMPLTDAACRSAKPSEKIRKLSDGGGLQLWIKPSASKLWRVAYRFGGKPKSLSLGAYPIVSLSDAREGRDHAKKLLAKGIDPSAAKKRATAEQQAAATTFRSIADGYVQHQKRNQRATATVTKLEWLLSLADASLGVLQVKDIRPADVLNVVRKQEARGRYETARRLLSTLGTIFRFAIVSGLAELDPTTALQRALASPPRQHRAAVTDPKAFGALLRAIDGFDGQPQTLAALKLMALLFPRPGELRAAQWTEIDLDGAVWVIPTARTKMRRTHKVPLSNQALVILRDLKDITGGGQFVFPSVRTSRKPLSENTLNAALRRMGYAPDEMSAHGFRACASTLLNESGKWHPDAIERQLAHIERNEVRAAYARGEHWDERVAMMQWWADQLSNLKAVGMVIRIGMTMRPVVVEQPAISA
jgi:integrase